MPTPLANSITTTTSPYTLTEALLAPWLLFAVVAVIAFILALITQSDDE